ncbi:MAG: carboxypeptidase regulatory-like domain-containing protein [Candidatus Aminicenantes bacterium]|nr:carboxypeptidase regulatory-like domain-containing protein [Candidatus Aminicenantes bacterium]
MKHVWGKALTFLMIFSLVGGFALAQVGVKAAVEGTVKDETGAVLPGVTVTLEGPMAPMVYYTTETGKYRFKALEIGTYTLTFELEGFEKFVREGVELKTAFTATVNVALRIAAVREAITVVAEAEMVDLKRSEITTNFGQEVLQGIPNARDPWVIFDKAPGVVVQRPNVGGDQSGQQTGFGAHGSADGQTLYHMDGGLITEHAAMGSTPTYYNFDSFAEIQVTTGGFDITSRGGGGVTVNLVTKTGGNEFHGQGGFYYVDEHLQTKRPDEMERGLNPHDMRIKQNMDYGVDIGGPILRDRMWFWGSAQEARIGRYFPVIYPPGSGEYAFGTTKLTNLNAKFIWRPVEDNQFSFYYQWGDKNWPTRSRSNGTNPQDDPDAYHVQSGPSPYYRVDDQHYWNPDFFTSIRYGFLSGYFHLAPQDMAYLTTRQAVRDRDANKLWFTAQYDYDTKRPQHEVDIDNNIYVDELLGGSHEFRIGFQHRRPAVTSITIYPQGLSISYYGEGTARNYVYMLTDQTIYDEFIRMTGIYFKDTYSRERLSINVGFRYDMSTGGRKAHDVKGNFFGDQYAASVYDPGIEKNFDWKDFNPRFGLNYDLTGDGKTAVRFNVARYSEMPSTWRGGWGNVIGGIYSRWWWDDLNDDMHVDVPDELTLRYYNYDPADPMAKAAEYRTAPGYGATRTWEILGGFDRELMEDLALTVSYHYRYIDNYTWIWYYLPDWSDKIDFSSWEPESVSYTAPDGQTYNGTVYNWIKPGGDDDYTADERTNYFDYYTQYSGVDIVLTKRYSNKWMGSAALTIGRASQHWPKGLQGESIDYPEDVGLKDGGIYGDNIPWMLKLTASYELPYGIRLGGFLNTRKGFPRNDVFPASKWYGYYSSTVEIDAYTPGKEYNDTYYCLDLRLEKTFDLGPGRLHGIVDIFNLFNNVPVLRSYDRVDRANYLDAYFPYTLGARAVRFAVRYSF